MWGLNANYVMRGKLTFAWNLVCPYIIAAVSTVVGGRARMPTERESPWNFHTNTQGLRICDTNITEQLSSIGALVKNWKHTAKYRRQSPQSWSRFSAYWTSRRTCVQVDAVVFLSFHSSHHNNLNYIKFVCSQLLSSLCVFYLYTIPCNFYNYPVDVAGTLNSAHENVKVSLFTKIKKLGR